MLLKFDNGVRLFQAQKKRQVYHISAPTKTTLVKLCTQWLENLRYTTHSKATKENACKLLLRVPATLHCICTTPLSLDFLRLPRPTNHTSEVLHACKHRWHTHFVDNLLQALPLHTKSLLSSPLLSPLHSCSTETQQTRQTWAHMHSYLSLIQFFEMNSALQTKASSSTLQGQSLGYIPKVKK